MLENYPFNREPPLFMQSEVVDPVLFAGPGLCLTVRMMRPTERVLHDLCASEGLEFWGHAAGLILDYFAADDRGADLVDVIPGNAPAMLLQRGGARRYAPNSTSRRVNVILSTPARDWIAGECTGPATPRNLARLCSLILHRNAATGANLVRAARRLGGL
jgi:hypothetical protein